MLILLNSLIYLQHKAQLLLYRFLSIASFIQHYLHVLTAS